MNGKYLYTPSEVITKRIQEETGVEIDILGTIIVGFTPEEAESLAIKSLTEGIPDMWKLRTIYRNM